MVTKPLGRGQGYVTQTLGRGLVRRTQLGI